MNTKLNLFTDGSVQPQSGIGYGAYLVVIDTQIPIEQLKIQVKVQRFEETWGETIVQGLSRAAELPVQIEADKAIFLDGEDTVFILHRSESGDWKFHL